MNKQQPPRQPAQRRLVFGDDATMELEPEQPIKEWLDQMNRALIKKKSEQWEFNFVTGKPFTTSS